MKKITKYILCIIMLIGVFTTVQASSFKDSYYGDSKTILFDSTDSGVSATDDTYPYNGKAKIEAVGFDVVYGMTKQLVRYKGEIPYKETRDEDSGTPISGLGNIPFRENTSIKEDKNPSYYYKGKVKKNASVEDYWGKGVKITEDEISRADLEKINDDSIKSLRLYAAQKSEGSLSFIAYALSGLIWLGTQIISLVLMIKNISMTALFKALNIDSLNTTMNEIFLGTNGKISPIAMFCIVSFMIAIAAFVVRFITGKETLKSLFSNVIVIALTGLILIGASYTGKVGTLANVGSQFVNNVLLSINPAMLTTDGLFLTKTVGGDSSQDLLTQELSMINKINIDVQICTQFGVQKMSELNFDELGDKDGKMAKAMLSGLDNPSQVANNLGYYFWYANSGAESLDRTKPPKIKDLQEEKLGSMITYLQQLYNKYPDKQEKIKNMILSISSPKGLAGVVYALMLIAIYTLLSLALWRYCIACAKSKLEFAIALLALPIAGLLLFSARKNLVKTGKGILGIFFTSIIKVILYSAIFDIILYVVSSVLNVSMIGFILVLILVFMFYKLRNVFEQHINNMIQSIERTYSPQGLALKRQMRTSFNQMVNRKAQEAENQQKLVGYDEHGNPIYKKTGAWKKAFYKTAADMTVQNATSRQGLKKITSDAKQSSETAEEKATNQLTSAETKKAKSALKSVIEDVDRTTIENLNAMKDEKGDYIPEKLTKNEQELHEKIKRENEKVEALENDTKYKQLMAKDNLSEAETEQLRAFHKAIETNEKIIQEDKIKLNNSVSDRAMLSAQQKYAPQLTKALENVISTSETQAKLNTNRSRDDIENIIRNKKELQALKNKQNINTVISTAKDREIAQKAVDTQYDPKETDKAAGIVKLNLQPNKTEIKKDIIKNEKKT